MTFGGCGAGRLEEDAGIVDNSVHPADLVHLTGEVPGLGCAAEGAWAAMKASLGNLAVRDVDQLAAIMKNRLKRIQYRPALIEAFLAQTGLTFEPQPP